MDFLKRRFRSKSDANASLLRAARAGNIEKVLELLKGSSDINASNANGLNALHLAAKEGHVTIVEEVLKRGANVDAATKKGNTALHIASLAGQLEVIGILLNSGAKVNLQSQNGFTPLYMAAQENHVQVVGYLLDHGALQTLTTEDGFTPLAVALQQGHDKVVAVLLENDSGGKVHLPALHIAAKKDDVKAAKLLLENDHNVDKISKNGSLANDTTKSGFTPLHIAAHYGNTNVAKLLIEKGSDVNFKARNFIMPLHVSSKWGRANMIALLLDSGAVIDPTTRDGLTPLHCAARSGHEQVVDLLLERGAPVTAKTKNGLSPLHMAVQGDHVDCARLLLLHKAPINDVTVDYLTPLHVAAHCGNVRTAKLLLDRKCEVNARALNGFTPLHIACKKNRIKVVELLLKYGAAIEATTESGLTPIHVASFMGHMNIVIFLIQHGANPDFTTVRGETALHLAARANQTDIIRILLRNRAQVDARAREQQTPLHIASRLGNVDNVLLLLQHGASPDAAMKDLSTPLHIAAKEGHEEVAMILLEHGASQSLTTKKGFSTLHVAAKFGRMKVVRLLLEKGADPNVEGRNGLTPLHVATHYNHVNVALLLLEKDADPCIAAKNGYAALHIAAKKNQMDIASALFQYGAKPDDDSRNGFTPLHLATQEGHTDMVALLLEHEADANCRAKNGLTPMHLAAQEDGVPVAEILVKYGSQIDSQTKAGYTPLHTASHFGQNNMIRFLLERDASIDTKTKLGYTPLHHAAQQGHLLAVKLLLRHGAFPNNITNSGQTAMSIAQRLGYISVVEILRPVTDESASQASLDEKYKVISPEIMQEAPLSDSEDEGCDDHALPDQTFHYLVSGEMKQFQDDSVAPTMESRDLFAFEGHSRKRSMSSSMGPGIIQEEMKYMRGDDDGVDGKTTDLKTDQISRHNVGVMSSAPSGGGGGGSSYHGDCYSRPYGGSSSSAAYDVDNVIPTNTPSFSFLVSFLVDARGGAMRGCRHSGVRIVVPPNCALMPTRITCRLVKREKLMHPPPLMEGEALASRVLEMGPAGAKLLRPMVIEVPHFAALRGDEREIGILRSDDGLTWREHLTPQVDDAGHDFIQSQFEDLDATEDVQLKRLVRVVTADFPQYFALVSRVRQDIGVIGADGGVLSSKVIPQVQAVFPPASFNKTTKVGLQAQLVPPELVSKLLGNRVAVSPLVTIEPRRRKFHRPITLTIPLPKAAQKGMLNQYGSDTPNLRLLCSVSGVDTFSYLRGENGCLDISPSDWKGGVAPSVWEDITGSTPLTLVNDCVSFTTSVSARFWLMDCQNIGESTKMATDLYREVIAVPFMSKFVVFAKHLEVLEARLRVFCMTDDRIEKTLENQEHFVEVARSRDIEVLEGKPLFLEMGGNVIPVTKSGDQLVLVFRAFHENRLPFIVRIRDMSQETKSRLAFMREPRVVRGDISQSPVCNLNIRLPGLTCSPAGDQNDVAMVTRMMPTQFSMEEHIAKAELKLTDIADLLQADWIALADQLGVTDNEVTRIQSEYDYVSEQALVMLHLWVQKNENRATGNDLERALKNIGRDDVIASCMCEVKEVTDATEKAVARVYLDASYDPLKDEMGSSHEFDSSRGSSMLRGQSLDVSYDEQDILKDSESFAEETGSEAGSVVEKEDFEKKADAESAEYELEEVWDGTQWNVVRKTPLKNSEVESKTSPETNEASYERKPTLEEKTVETVEPGNAPGASEDSQRTEEVVDLDDWEVVDELPTDGGDDDDEVPKGDSTPGEIDTTPEQLPYPEQRLMVESSPIGHEEEEEETEERIFTSSTVHEEETVLEDGTNVRKRVTTTRHVRISGGGGGKGGEFPEETGQLIGTEIEEEVLILAPGVVESSGKDLQRETSVEEYEEALPDGTWEKRKVTTVTVTSRIAPFMTEEVERLAEEKEEEEEESPAVEEQSFYHSQHPVSGFSHAEDSFPEDFEHSDEIVEEKIIPQTTQRPQRVPRPQESAFSSPEEREEEEEGEEEIGAVRAEYQYSGSEDFNREPVKEPEIVRENLRKVEISVDELFSTPLPPEVTLETEDTKTAGSGDDDDDDRPTTEAAPTSGDQFILGLCTPHIAVQAPSPLVQSPVEQEEKEEKEKEEEEESGAKFEDVTGVVIVADDQDRSTEEFSSDDVTAATTCDVRADDAEEEEEEEQSGSLAAEPEIEMSGRISVDTSQQIFIEQMIETSLESTALSPTDQIRPPPPSDSSSFAAHLQSAAAAVDFNRDLTIRPTDLSPLTPTPDPTEQTMPSLFDSAPSPEHGRNELEDWTRDRADEDEEGAEKEEEEEAGSASSLSEVAQVDDVNQSQDAEYRGFETDTRKEREHGEHDDVSPKSADEIARWSDERKKREQEEADD